MNTELEIVDQIDGQLVAFAGKSGLEQASTTPLVTAFRPVFIEARRAIAEASGVAESVKDATCVTQIKQARACRLAIRRVRLAGDAVRKAQKATALTYGRAVDGFYNILEADLAPVEKALQDAEDTAERAEAARLDAVESGRKAALAPFVTDVALYAVRDMAEPVFAALLAGVKAAKEQAEAAAAKAEADRIAKEKAEAAERERIRAENERLRKEAEEKEAAFKAERERVAKENAEKEAALKAERERVAKEQAAAADRARKEREAIEAKAKAEREAAEEVQRKERLRLQAEAEAERQKAAALEAKAKAEREAREKAEREEAAARRKAAAAPDKQKLQALRTALLDFALPEMSTKEGQSAVNEAESRLTSLAEFIQLQAAKM